MTIFDLAPTPRMLVVIGVPQGFLEHQTPEYTETGRLIVW